MFRGMILTAFAATALTVGFLGCGTATQSPPVGDETSASLQQAQEGGTAFTFRVKWPETQAELIPAATTFIGVGVLDKAAWDRGEWVEYGFRGLTKEQPSGKIGGLPVSTECLIVAAAFPDYEPPPEGDNTGTAGIRQDPTPDEMLKMLTKGAVATGSFVQTSPAVEGQIGTVTLTLSSTINRVVVEPASLQIGVRDGRRLVATAYNADNEVVLVAQEKWSWTTSDPALVGIFETSATWQAPDDPNFLPPLEGWAYIGALDQGNVTITVTDTESGKSAAATVSVTGLGGVTLTGRVVNAQNVSLGLANVDLLIGYPPAAGTASTRVLEIIETDVSGSDGSYSLTHLPPGMLRLEIVPPAGSGFANMAFNLELPSSDMAKTVPLRLTVVPADLAPAIGWVDVEPWQAVIPPGSQLQYQSLVANQNGAPMNLAPIWLTDPWVGSIDPTGLFTARPYEGHGRVIAVVGNHAGAAWIGVGHDLGIAASGGVEGAVASAVNPDIHLANARVVLLAPNASNTPPVAETYSDSEGGYKLEGVPAGPGILRVEPPQGLNYSPTQIGVDVPGGDFTYVKVTMVPGTVQQQIASVMINPLDATVAPGATRVYRGIVKDAAGNAMTIWPTWSVLGGVGWMETNWGADPPSATFTAHHEPLRGQIIMAVGTETRTTGVTVSGP